MPGNSLSHAELTQLARLARLHLSDEELARYGEQLGTVLEHFQKLQELDLDGVPPTGHVIDLENVFRDDISRPSMNRSEVLRNASGHLEKNYLRIPRVV